MVKRALRWPASYQGRASLRLIPAALVGAVLGAIGALFWQWEQGYGRSCVPEPDVAFPCLGFAPLLPLAAAFGLPILFLFAVAVLWRVRVPRAAATAAAGAIALVVLLGIYLASEYSVNGDPPPPLWLAALAGAGSFVVGAIVCAQGSGWVLRVTASVTAIAALAAIPAWSAASTDAYRRNQFEAMTVPLLVPQLAGHEIRAAYAFQAGAGFTAKLVPIGSDPYRTRRGIVSSVRPIPAGFAPPVRCGPLSTWASDSSGHAPCEAVGRDHWVRRDADQTEHIVRRAGALVILAADPAYVPAADLDRAVADLRVASTDELVDAV